MRDQKVYNWSDMDVDMILDDDPNTLKHEIKPTLTIRNFNNYIEKYEGEWIKRKEYPPPKRLLEKYNFTQFLDNQYNISYKLAPENL